MFLVNSRLGSLAAAYFLRSRQPLSRSYGRYFAEFLDAILPVRLGLLDHPTGVGLRYGFIELYERWFSWKQKGTDYPRLRGTFGIHRQLFRGICLPESTLSMFHVQSIHTL